jgi:hypothetical protein
MAWIYLAESADSHAPWRHGSDLSPIVKTIGTLRASCSLECDSAILRARQFGATSVHSGARICPWCQISFTADSRAKTSALPDMVLAWLASGLDFIGKSIASSKNAGQLSFFSKTSRPSGPVELAKWPSHLPQAGTIRAGILYPRLRSARPSLATVGFVLPRPTAKHYGSNRGGAKGRTGPARHSIHQMATRGLLPGHPKGPLNREYLEQVMGYPLRWTEIGALETEFFRGKPVKHSNEQAV